MHDEITRKIAKNKERLALTQGHLTVGYYLKINRLLTLECRRSYKSKNSNNNK